MYSLSDQTLSNLKQDCFDRRDEINIRGWGLPTPKNRDISPAISEITSNFCNSKRNIFLKYRLGIEPVPSMAMIYGGTMHSIVSHTFKKCRDIQNGTLDLQSLMNEMKKLSEDSEAIEEMIWEGSQLESLNKYCEHAGLNYETELNTILDWLKEIVNYQIERMNKHWQPLVSNIIHIEDVEGWVDGKPLETGWGRVDLIASIDGNPVVFDLKTGNPYKENLDSKIQIAAYAMALECATKKPVNLGCLIFPLNKNKTLKKTPLIDYFLIADELRKEFFKRRNHAFEVLSLIQPPGISDTFPCKYCGYIDTCHPGGF